MFFHKAPLAFIIFFLVAAVLFFCFLAYFYLWMCCRKRYQLKEQRKKSSEKKTNEERFHDLAKPDNEECTEQTEQTTKGSKKFYPIVFHNKAQETAELRLLWKPRTNNNWTALVTMNLFVSEAGWYFAFSAVKKYWLKQRKIIPAKMTEALSFEKNCLNLQGRVFFICYTARIIFPLGTDWVF